MATQKKNLFQRLTSLFKSGPVVRRKVRTADTTVAMADKTKSSGTLLFQKSMSPTYATITANAYNLSERLQRYQDFCEMEYCLSGDTKIPQPNNKSITLKELADKCDADPSYNFIVYSFDHAKGHVVAAYAKQARQTMVNDAWKVTFDDGRTITGTSNHRMMLCDGSYREIGDLETGDCLMPFYRRPIYGCSSHKEIIGQQCVYTVNSVHEFPYSLKKGNMETISKKVQGWSLEKRLIADLVFGCTDDSEIAHIDDNKLNNAPENLVVDGLTIRNRRVKARENSYYKRILTKSRSDITFARLLQSADENDFDVASVKRELDIDDSTISSIVSQYGFSSFIDFKNAYVQQTDRAEVSFTATKRDANAITADEIYSTITESDTVATCAKKLGITGNELHNILLIKVRKTWQQIRDEKGWPPAVKGNLFKISKAPDKLDIRRIRAKSAPGMTSTDLAFSLGVKPAELLAALRRYGFNSAKQFISNRFGPVVESVEYVGVIPLYDMTVDGYKNYATDICFTHNTPEIASALDIFADETCCADDKGKILHIHSEDEKKKEILEDLFYNVVNVEFNIRGWVRNLCKFGDMVLYNDVHPEYGVKNAFPIPVNEIEREENYDPNDPFAVRYRWVTLGNRTLENWEVTHFRLLGNDVFLPYGTSVLEAARRVWRQLILIEDAMLVYRIVRAPERRVFYVDVAGLPPENVPMYMEEQRARMRTDKVVDGVSGRMDMRYAPMPVHKDTLVPLLDGRTLTIEQVAEEYDRGIENWVHSVQDGTKNFVSGKVVWCGKNYTAQKLTKVWLNDDTFILSAPEHPFILSDGTKVRADELKAADSLMASSLNEHIACQVKSIESVAVDGEDVYCMTVVGNNGEHDRHNFAVIPRNIEKSPVANCKYIYISNSLDEDYWIPIRGNESGTRIDTLAGGQNAAAVEDVAYIQKKLFAALKVPKAYLNYEDSLSSKATLAQIDIRFSRTISTIQKTVIAELNKLAIIHLYAHGYDGADLQDFSLHMSNPSSVAQQQKLELWRTRFEIGGSLPEGMGSKEFVQREVWGLTDQQIKAINQQRLNEKKVDMEIENAIVEDSGGGGEDLFATPEEAGAAAPDLGLGGEEAGDGGEKEEPAETPPEENASETPPEEEDDDVTLLTSSEDRDDDDDYSLKVGAHSDKPIKPSKQLQRALYNRSRQRKHGASKTHMPDFKKMTGNDSESMKDVTGSSFLKSMSSNPFGESLEIIHKAPPVSADVKRMLERMSSALKMPKHSGSLLSESDSSIQEDIGEIDELDIVD